MRTIWMTTAALVVTASVCSAQTKTTKDTTKHNMAGMSHDADKGATGATGIPAGMMARADSSRMGVGDLSKVKYTKNGANWEITTGPAHIVYSPTNTASGSYTASATITQLAAPAHPEAFGIFIGGQDLDKATQKYTYFIVRGTGEYMIRVRDGAGTKDVVGWKASDAVPKADASGKATYNLSVHMAPDTAHFYVNSKLVAAVPKADIPTDGIAGLRVNHNLHVSTSGINIKK